MAGLTRRSGDARRVTCTASASNRRRSTSGRHSRINAENVARGASGAALAGIRATSLINMPLIERGKVVALLFVNNATPRAWSDEDIARVREVAERGRTASERGRAAADLEDSEARYRSLTELASDSICR